MPAARCSTCLAWWLLSQQLHKQSISKLNTQIKQQMQRYWQIGQSHRSEDFERNVSYKLWKHLNCASLGEGQIVKGTLFTKTRIPIWNPQSKIHTAGLSVINVSLSQMESSEVVMIIHKIARCKEALWACGDIVVTNRLRLKSRIDWYWSCK